MAQAHKLNGATTVHTSSQTLAYPRVEALASRRHASADHHIGTPNAKPEDASALTKGGRSNRLWTPEVDWNKRTKEAKKKLKPGKLRRKTRRHHRRRR
ncbi:unnamed protein product [Brassica rapa subsp. trilocularis]